MVPLRSPFTLMPSGRSLAWLFQHWANSRPDHPFLIWEPFEGGGRTWSYGEFWHEVCQYIAGLRLRGIKTGDRVVVHMDNCPEFLLSWWALTSMGAVAVCTNTKSAHDELSYFLQHSEASAVLTQPRFASLIDGAVGGSIGGSSNVRWLAVTDTDSGAPPRSGSGPDRTSSFASLRHTTAEGSDHFSAPLDAASIQYTSGTTSRPKAVVWTHANALWGARVSAGHAGVGPASISLVHLPLFHTNAMCYSMLASVWSGATIVLMPRFSASRFWDVAVRTKCTWSGIINFALKALESHPIPDKHDMTLMGNGANIARLETLYRVKIMPWYGMTETISHPIVGETQHDNRPGSCGRPAPEYRVAVVREDGSPVEPGETGDLRVWGERGVSLFAEYLHDATATAAAFDEQGWLITGDRVTVHEDGFITFSDRGKDMLRIGAENVAASEIERVIASVPGVVEVAVVGAPHDMLDEVPVAFLLADAGADPKVVAANAEAACRKNLARFKVPTSFRVVAELPRSTLEKVAKAQLRDLLRQEAQGESDAV